ncbi:MAG TPA: murein L,D-transpeptidase catalytic domain family protein [Mucilaginibacter sp.]|nr:murein L,D-transpeptidase catalytic domain family protein [Mucilaginibacter sp.]
MSKGFLWVTCILSFFSITMISWKVEKINKSSKASTTVTTTTNTHTEVSAKELFTQYLDDIYNTAQLHVAGLDRDVFQKAVTGYFNLKAAGEVPQYSSVITIVDLAKSSCLKRMWIVDLMNKELVLNTWVAHGSGSGGDMAQYFSNENDSHASSLGFYVTDGVYQGKHGRSLKLDGVDAGFNDNARARSIVVHAAAYVSMSSIDKLGRLGRSEGCPAVSPKVIGKVIEAIKGRTVLFINGNDGSYSSKYLDQGVAANYMYPDSSSVTASL